MLNHRTHGILMTFPSCLRFKLPHPHHVDEVGILAARLEERNRKAPTESTTIRKAAIVHFADRAKSAECQLAMTMGDRAEREEIYLSQ